MMKKSLIALAVAGVVAAPAAFAATSNVDVFGAVRMSVDKVNSKLSNGDYVAVKSQTSRFGAKGTEDLGGGLSAIWQLDWEVDSADNSNNGATIAETDTNVYTVDGVTLTNNTLNVGNNIKSRNQFVGIKGAFGTVLAGRHDTPYKLAGSADIFGDTSADSQKASTGIIGRNNFDNRANNAIAYISPDFNGFHAAIAVIPGEQAATANTSTDANGYANGFDDAKSLALVYKNGPLSLTYGHEVFSKEMNGASVSSSGVLTATADTNKSRKADKYNIGYDFGAIKVGYTYEKSHDGHATTQLKDKGQLASLAYTMGPIVLGAQYGKFDDADTNNRDLTRTTVGAFYNMSKRTQGYVAYNNDNFKNDTNETAASTADTTVWTVGLNHSF